MLRSAFGSVLALSVFFSTHPGAAAIVDRLSFAAKDALLRQAEEDAIRKQVDALLAEDDIEAARALVDRLLAEDAIDLPRAREIDDHIWRTKAERMIDYARRITAALAASDLEAVRDYSARMQRLRAADGVEAAAVGRAATGTGDAETGQTGEPEVGRVPPETEQAEEAPQSGIVAALIEDEKARAATLVEDGRYEDALAVADDLLERLRTSDDAAVAGLAQSRRVAHEDLVERWRETLRADAIAGLLHDGEEAIARRALTVAGEGSSALSALIRLEGLAGGDHEAVADLAGRILTGYDELIDRSLARNQFDRARLYGDRKVMVSRRFDLPASSGDALRGRIDRAETNARYEALLQLAERARAEDRLVTPASRSAMAFAAEAAALGHDDPRAARMLETIVESERERIGGLVAAERLAEAGDALLILAGALEQTQTAQSAIVPDLRREAGVLVRRAEAKATEAEPVPLPAAGPTTASEPNDTEEPFTFVSPF